MGRFEQFYTGEDTPESEATFPDIDGSVRVRQTRERPKVSQRQLHFWKKDLSKCSSILDYQNYVKKYNTPENPYINEAKQKIDDLSFASCKSIEDYNAYLASFPSGEHVLDAKVAIWRLQANINNTNGSSTNTNSQGSKISSDDIGYFIKKAIGVIAIIILIALIIGCIAEDGRYWQAVAGYCVFIGFPVCKWAFDD